MTGFLAELKRRNVIRMAGLYLLGAWLVTQVAETLLPAFDVPTWVLRAIIIVLALGFVPALVFAWVFELTPDGLKRDAEVASAASIAPQTARRMDRLILVGALAVVAVLVVERVWIGSRRESAAAMTGAVPAASAPAPSEASIAVLPFVNMSADNENSFFADGISEELLNVLSGIEGLKVASRTSSFSFKGKDTPIPEIARLLDVRHVVEGSVRKQGQRVRVTAQLIHAGTDGHLWSETYDRDLTDIFKVQEEIAQAITRELESLLGKRRVSLTASTTNLDAYERFLSGRARFHRRDEFKEAVADLQYAVEKDPEFAEAWVYLALTHFTSLGYGSRAKRPSPAEVEAPLRTALERARALVPRDPRVLAVDGQLKIRGGDDLAGLQLLGETARLSERDSTPVMWLGQQLLRAGYVDEAITALERAERMEPKVGINLGALSIAYLSAGQHERALEKATQAAELGWGAGLSLYEAQLAASGERERAARMTEADFQKYAPATIRIDPEQRAELHRWTTAVRNPTPANIDALDLRADEIEELFIFGLHGELLDRLQRQTLNPHPLDDSGSSLRMFWLPAARPLREDSRFLVIAEQMGLLRLWETRGYPPGCKRASGPGGDHLDCAGIRQ